MWLMYRCDRGFVGILRSLVFVCLGQGGLYFGLQASFAQGSQPIIRNWRPYLQIHPLHELQVIPTCLNIFVHVET